MRPDPISSTFIDDVAKLFINNQLILTRTFNDNDTGDVDITKFFAPGSNKLRFTLENITRGYTFGFQLKVNGNLIFEDICGNKGVLGQGCNNEDFTLGMVYDATITLDFPSGEIISITGGLIPSPTPTPTPTPLTCSPTFQQHVVNQSRTFTASGGTGNYVWSIGGTEPETCTGITSADGTSFEVSCSTIGQRDINLDDGTNPTVVCTFKVVSPGPGEF